MNWAINGMPLIIDTHFSRSIGIAVAVDPKLHIPTN